MLRACLPSLFPLLGIDPIRGRHFLPEEDRPAARRVALVSYDLWQRQFEGDPGVLGRTVYLDDRPHTIVGVLPEDCRFPAFPRTSGRRSSSTRQTKIAVGGGSKPSGGCHQA